MVRLPLTSENSERKYYSETTAADKFKMLQQTRKLSNNNSEDNHNYNLKKNTSTIKVNFTVSNKSNSLVKNK